MLLPAKKSGGTLHATQQSRGRAPTANAFLVRKTPRMQCSG